jgi:hypothetical protein
MPSLTVQRQALVVLVGGVAMAGLQVLVVPDGSPLLIYPSRVWMGVPLEEEVVGVEVLGVTLPLSTLNMA